MTTHGVTNSLDSDVNATILERIQKLLALTDSSNANEAANAAAKVQELLDAHNLSMSQVHGHEGPEQQSGVIATERHITFGPNTSALNKAWTWLMNMVARQNNCAIIITRGYEIEEYREKRVARFIVIGEQTNIEAVITLYQWLRSGLEIEATNEWPIYKADMLERGYYPGDPIPFRINFIHGAVVEIEKIMADRREQSEHYQAITALAVNHEQAIVEYKEENHPNIRPGRKSGSQGNAFAFRRGKEAGARVERSRRGLEGN